MSLLKIRANPHLHFSPWYHPPVFQKEPRIDLDRNIPNRLSKTWQPTSCQPIFSSNRHQNKSIKLGFTPEISPLSPQSKRLAAKTAIPSTHPAPDLGHSHPVARQRSPDKIKIDERTVNHFLEIALTP
jgi:hypothetical protein